MSVHRPEAVKIGVVGLGSFGRLHAQTLAGLAEARLVALVDPRAEALRDVAAAVGQPATFTDLDAAQSQSDAQAWVVATPTRTHVDVASRLLRAGKTVLLEKPVADSLDEARALAPLVRPDSRNLMLGHVALFNTEFRELLDQAKQRGPIRYLSACRHRSTGHIQHFPGETPFHLTMVHDLYMAYALLNRAQPVAFGAQAHHTASVCDLALAQLQFADGAVASFAASFLTPPGMGFEGFDRTEVFGDGWAARIEPNPRPLSIWDDAARHPLTLEIRSDPSMPTGMLAEELRCFCRVARGEQPVPVGATYHDAMQIMTWLDQLTSCVRCVESNPQN